MARTLTTAWRRRLRLGWALLASLLIVVGLAIPASAPTRAPAEYSQPGPAAVEGVRYALAPVAAFAAADEPGPAMASGAPGHGVTPSGPARDAFGHAYEATGPPTDDLSMPA